MRLQAKRHPQIIALIGAVRQNPTLYDYRMPEYYNNAFNDSVWQIIARDCDMSDANEAKNLWEGLHHSFTVFYRNELIRLVRANYDEIDSLPQEISDTPDERFGKKTWGYYSDMRFVAPFRIKGSDPELDRLIDLAKPIVQSDSHKAKLLSKNTAEPVANLPDSSLASAAPGTQPGESQNDSGHDITATVTSNGAGEEFTHLDIVPVSSLEGFDNSLGCFFDAMFRSTNALPAHLQRRVKRELLQSLHSAEAEAEQLT